MINNPKHFWNYINRSCKVVDLKASVHHLRKTLKSLFEVTNLFSEWFLSVCEEPKAFNKVVLENIYDYTDISILNISIIEIFDSSASFNCDFSSGPD